LDKIAKEEAEVCKIYLFLDNLLFLHYNKYTLYYIVIIVDIINKHFPILDIYKV